MIHPRQIETLTLPTRAGVHPLPVVRLHRNTVFIACAPYDGRGSAVHSRRFIRDGAILVSRRSQRTYAHCDGIEEAILSARHTIEWEEGEAHRMRVSLAGTRMLFLNAVLMGNRWDAEFRTNPAWTDGVRALLSGLGRWPIVPLKTKATEQVVFAAPFYDSRDRKNDGMVQARLETTRRLLGARVADAVSIAGHVTLRQAMLVCLRDRMHLFLDKLEGQIEQWERGILKKEGSLTKDEIRKFRRQMRSFQSELRTIHVLPLRHFARHAVMDLSEIISRLTKLSRARTRRYVYRRFAAMKVGIELQRSAAVMGEFRLVVAHFRRIGFDCLPPEVVDDYVAAVRRLHEWCKAMARTHARTLRNNKLEALDALCEILLERLDKNHLRFNGFDGAHAILRQMMHKI